MPDKHVKNTIERVSAMIEEQALTKEQLIGYLRQAMEIRALENNISTLLGKAVLKGASHLYAGSEAVAVRAVGALREGDLITSTHRGHGHAHAHGDSAAKTPEEKQAHYNKMMAEVLGKSGGYCKGKGGSMHIADVSHGNLGATGIVGGNLPVAVGAGLAQKLMGSDKVVLCFFGDGASNTGNFHEALNMASLWDLPVVFVVENNMYAMSVPWAKSSKLPNVADRACAYGIPGEVVDGMDVLAVRGAVEKAVSRARKGKAQALLKLKLTATSVIAIPIARVSRKEEEQAYKDRDPIKVLNEAMKSVGLISEEEFEGLNQAVKAKMKTAMEFSEASPDVNPAELDTDVYAPSEFTVKDIEDEAILRDKVKTDASMREISYADAIVEALREEMKRDDRVFLMGEDVGLYGGAYGASRGLFEEFGQWRVIDTPISEATIGGAAVGAAMAGMRPVAEIMYVDFTPLAMDQVANQGAKNRYMFGGKTSVPMVIRTEGGAGRAIAAHHSQSLEALWTHFPGIYVVMPSTPYDVKGLLKAAIRDNNPVMFIEHKMLYKNKGRVPEGDYIIPLGVADIKTGWKKDVTLVTYSRQVLNALDAAEALSKEGIDVEVIDLRCLKPLDINTVINSIKKTGRFVGVTEAYENTSFINEVMAQVNDAAFDYLDAPMVRVAAANVPVPRAEVLEDLAIPNVNRIIQACRKVVR